MSDSLARVYELLGHWLIAWTLVVALVLTIGIILRPRRPAIRYAGWLLALFSGPVLLMLASVIEPVTTWRQLSAVAQTTGPHDERQIERFRSIFPRGRDASPTQIVAASNALLVDDAAVAPTIATPQSTATRERLAAESVANLPIALWFGALWVMGGLIFVAKLLYHLSTARLLVRRSTLPVSPALAAVYELAEKHLRLRRRVRLAVHPQLQTPIFVGGLRPTVLWPAPQQDAMSPAERRAAIVHELGHAARRDDWVNVAAELWRAASWFYLPVHWLTARIRREQEFLSDDLAAGLFDRPEAYAQLLLNVTPVRVDAGSACIAFAGTGLQARVRRLLATKLRRLVPLRRAQVIGLSLAAFVILIAAGSLRLVSLAEEPIPADAATPLPETTPQDLAEKVREALRAYQSGVVEATYVESRLRDDLEAPQTVAWEGRFQYASDGYRWRGEYESQTYSQGKPGLRPRGWSAGFEGEVHFRRDLNGPFVLGEQQAHEEIPLPGVVWSSHGSDFPRSLSKDDWQMTGQELIGGYRCYALERERKTNDSEWRYELALSPRQNYLPLRYKVFVNGNLYSSHELVDMAKTDGGTWYPKRIHKIQNWMDRTYDISIVRYESHPLFDAAYFRPQIPWGEHVRDWRTGEVYINDPWWPDVEPLVRGQGDWPADFMPLRDMASYADPAINGQSAPPLAVAEWISGEPVDLASRRGQVTLLFFSSGSLWSPEPAQVSALRELYKVYRPFGLQIVGVITHSTGANAARQQIEELRTPWPVAIDAEGGSYGRTFEAYGLETYLSPVLVDHEGAVHLVQRSQLPSQLKQLLDSAGEQQVPEISLEYVNLRYGSGISQTWRAMVEASPRPARILGDVRDKEGPLAGVQVEAHLRLELTASIHTTAATALFPYRNEVFRTTTGEDGKYVLGDLCKGTYRLSFKLPGRAIVEQRVVLAPDEMAETVDADLSQPDGIQGRVLDESGRPVAKAHVSIRHRHPYLADLSFTSTFFRDPSVTDTEGRFQFKDLQTGAYTLDVSHPDYEERALEHVPAGEADAVIRLKRGGG